MNLNLRAAVLLAGAMVGVAASAAPVLFEIDGVALTPGAGYGVDAGPNGENGGTRLDVLFGTLFAPQSFALEVGASHSFDLAQIILRESDAGSGANAGIRAAESDDLGVGVQFSFSGALAGVHALAGNGLTTLQAIGDPEVDYVLDWQPLVVGFGNGGAFQISLDDVAFSDRGTLTQTVSVTLLAAPQPATVHEPGSLALAGLALIGLAAGRRRRVG